MKHLNQESSQIISQIVTCVENPEIVHSTAVHSTVNDQSISIGTVIYDAAVRFSRTRRAAICRNQLPCDVAWIILQIQGVQIIQVPD